MRPPSSTKSSQQFQADSLRQRCARRLLPQQHNPQLPLPTFSFTDTVCVRSPLPASSTALAKPLQAAAARRASVAKSSLDSVALPVPTLTAHLKWGCRKILLPTSFFLLQKSKLYPKAVRFGTFQPSLRYKPSVHSIPSSPKAPNSTSILKATENRFYRCFRVSSQK